MLLKILLIIIGLPILILPLATDLMKNKKITKSGIAFLFFVILFTALQIVNERQNSKAEAKLESEKQDLSNNVDSLKIRTQNLSDSLSNFKKVLLSIDSKFYNTNNKLSDLSKINDSLNIKLIQSDRPIFHLTSTKIYKSKIYNNQHTIDFDFGNEGVRAATNIYGRMFTFFADTLFDNGDLGITKSDTYPNKKGFTIHAPMKVNPDSSSLAEPIYYYFSVHYSDLILKTSYSYVVVMKLPPFKKGNCMNELAICKNWEENMMIKRVEKTLHNKL
ncbi:hypothetical protein [Maribellus maritimus]|uniref:hypothetical protein n=1 Tax=Maribellus maritimus TaxID=2870838 RepID=UPI001EEBF404|nr:hypothetical protein [Maribellus maritimus]MCG6191354.1 hypothetical protein [Maribellus maritimus]